MNGLNAMSLKDRAALYGTDSLSDGELLSLVTNIDKDSLQKAINANGLHNLLGRMDSMDITLQQKIRVEAAYQIGQRISRAKSSGGVVVVSPEDIGWIFVDALQYKEVEVAQIALLNTRNRLIRLETLATGTSGKAMIVGRDVARIALRYNAVSVILAHNHVSGELEPSQADIRATKDLANALSMIGIKLLDHIVVGHGEYASLRKIGLI